MTTTLWVALGSAIGGAARYWCSGLIASRAGEAFPWGTLAVNVVGSVAIGLFATLSAAEGRWLLPQEARQFVAVGLLGGFTTFSSFSLQTFALFNDGEWLAAAVNIVASVALCMLGVWLGHTVGVQLNR